jgi:trk system potassium uptake protein TrkA
MKIIIAGAGDVGFHLAMLLSYENQEITVIDMDEEKLKHISSKLDVATIKGNCTSYKSLEEADVKSAKLLISATSSEETNITTAIFAKHLGAKKTVARVKNLEYLQERERTYLRELGIDEIISPEYLASKEIKRLLGSTVLTDVFDFEDGKLTLLGILIDEQCVLRNKTLAELSYLNPDNDFITVALLRKGETIIPHGNNSFLPGDHAYFLANPKGVDKVLSFNHIKKKAIKNVMILGGSYIARHTAKHLSEKYNIKLIEQDKQKCFDLADSMPNVLVVHGDGRNSDLIEQEGIQNMDAFIALTGNSETNIISSLVAKQHGVEKTIALVENVDYIHLSQNIGVDTLINRKLIAANFIFRYIRKGDIMAITSIHGVDAEIVEFVVKEKSKITTQYIKNLKFPKNALIGGIVRKERSIIPNGDFRIRTDDRVVVLCSRQAIHTVEEFFN